MGRREGCTTGLPDTLEGDDFRRQSSPGVEGIGNFTLIKTKVSCEWGPGSGSVGKFSTGNGLPTPYLAGYPPPSRLSHTFVINTNMFTSGGAVGDLLLELPCPHRHV